MNRKELSQLYYLKREIANDEQRLIELESAATSVTSRLGGMPGGGRRSDKTAIAAEIADLKAILSMSLLKNICQTAPAVLSPSVLRVAEKRQSSL